MEQPVNVKFCVKLEKSATEMRDLLKRVYGDECVSRTQVFEWVKRFKEGTEEIGHNQRPGRPSTSKTGANIEKVSEIFRQNRRLNIRAVVELINIDSESFDRFYITISPLKKCVRRWCRDFSLLNKRNSKEH